MPELADLLERKSGFVDLAPGGFERLARRRERHLRNRRIGAGVLALMVALAAVAAIQRANRTKEVPIGLSSVTPGPSVTPSPSVTHSPSVTPPAVAGFPGFPPEGAKPTEPTTGTLELSYLGPDGPGSWMDLNVYSDGRM